METMDSMNTTACLFVSSMSQAPFQRLMRDMGMLNLQDLSHIFGQYINFFLTHLITISLDLMLSFFVCLV